MTYILFFLLALLSSNNYIAAQDRLPNELTSAEDSCFTWLNEQSKKLPPILNELSEEDQDVFNKGLHYTDHYVEVLRSRWNYVSAFCKLAKTAGIALKYDEATLQSTVLKVAKIMHSKNITQPTTLLEARMYVFSTLLTVEEQATWKKDGYLANPLEAAKAVTKWSTLVSVELAKLKLIKNTKIAKIKKARELYNEKIETLQKSYCSASQKD